MPKSSEPAWTPFERVDEICGSSNPSLPPGTIYRNRRYQVVVRMSGLPSEALLVWL